MISEAMVDLVQTMHLSCTENRAPILVQTVHLSCTETNTVSKRTETSFHLSLVT
jgi:hypothetical protein